MLEQENDLIGNGLSSDSDNQTDQQLSQSDLTTEETISDSDQSSEQTDRASEQSENSDQQPAQQSDNPEEPANNNREEPENDAIENSSDIPEPPAEQESTPARSSKERTWTFRATPEVDGVLLEIQQKFDCTKGAAVNKLLDHLTNREPEKVIEEKVIEKEVEVVKHVARPSMPGEVVCKLNDDQIRVIDTILERRKEKAAKKGVQVEENRSDILIKGLFIQDRLFNYDNAFFTGLSKKDVQ